MEESDIYNVIHTRIVTSSISLFACFALIIIYIILCLQVKCNILVKKEGKKEKNYECRNSFIEHSGLKKDMDKSHKKKIGLGSHYMFHLIISNFIGEIFEFAFVFYYKHFREAYPSSVEKKIDNSKLCVLFGFSHNFFDILSICWTTMLSLLFYSSTKITSEMFFKDTKFLLIGFAYGLSTCFICCVIPLWFKLYGFADTYCSFKLGKSDVILFGFKLFTLLVIVANSIYNVFAFYKTSKYYWKKLGILKKQNQKEYRLVKKFVFVFLTFPGALVVIRLFKLINTIIVENYNDKEYKRIVIAFSYLNDVSFNLNGFINAFACIFFFRGVLWCCSSSKNNKEDEKNENFGINIGSNVISEENNNQMDFADEDNKSINEMKEK